MRHLTSVSRCFLSHGFMIFQENSFSFIRRKVGPPSGGVVRLLEAPEALLPPHHSLCNPRQVPPSRPNAAHIGDAGTACGRAPSCVLGHVVVLSR